MWQGWISLIIGVWLILSGLSSGLQGPFNMVLFGLLAVLVGFFLLRGWEGVFTGIFGIWLIISGFISGFVTAQNFIVIGILISIISIIKIYHAHRGVETKHKIA
jgi:hypothetical protein